MAHITADRVADTSTTTGTGAFTVSGTAPTGYRTFSAVCSTNDTLWYCIAHQSQNEWEVGYGTYSASNQITRTTVLSSSNSGSAVNFSSGTKDVFLTLAAGRTQINVQQFTASGTWTKPAGFSPSSRVLMQAWGGGGGGFKGTNFGSGGGGGGYHERWLTLSAMGATETITIGAGGTGGTSATAGGNTTVGSLLTAYGGAAGTAGQGGGGGGQLSAGSNLTVGTTYNSPPGNPRILNYWDPSTSLPYWQGGGSTTNNTVDYCSAFMHGGGGGASTLAGGTSVWGGGGGGGYNAGAAGSSSFGGAGGAGSSAGTAGSGTQPGGGGGGTSTGTAGGGAAGQVIITVFPA